MNQRLSENPRILSGVRGVTGTKLVQIRHGGGFIPVLTICQPGRSAGTNPPARRFCNRIRLIRLARRRGSKLHQALDQLQWARVRRQVFKRDGYRCRACGRAGRLECDHKIPLHRGGAEFDLDNLQSLCRACHIAKTAVENSRPDAERAAWREFLKGPNNI